MKRTTLIIIMMSLIAMFMTSSGVMAQDGFSLSFAFSAKQSPVGYGETLDLGSLGPWLLAWTGSATVSPTTANATITGGFADNLGARHIWKYEYSVADTDEEPLVWETLDLLVDPITAYKPAIGASGVLSDSATVTARWLKLSYAASLVGKGSSASGSGSIAAAAVPEPGTILAAFSILGPAGFLFRRRQ